MAPSKCLSTPKWPEEERAWLLVYQKRLGDGKPLCKAFNEQFEKRESRTIKKHASLVGKCSDEIRSQLLDLAKTYTWYEDPPQEGTKEHERMKKIEKKQQAKDRRSQWKREVESESKGNSANAGGADVPPPSSPKQKISKGTSALKNTALTKLSSRSTGGSGTLDSPVAISSSSSNASPSHSPNGSAKVEGAAPRSSRKG